MGSFPLTRHSELDRHNVVVMPDPKQAALAKCMELARRISAECPQVRRDCEEMLVWLESLQRITGLSGMTFESPRDYSSIVGKYEAALAILKDNGGELTEQTLYEAMVAGRVQGSKDLGFRGNLRRALSQKERKEIEVVKSESGRREDDIVRLRSVPNKPAIKRAN